MKGNRNSSGNYSQPAPLQVFVRLGTELGFCGRENTSRVSFDTFYPYHEPFVPFGSNCAKTLAISKACEYVFNFQPNPFQLLCLKFKFAVIGATKLHVLLIFFIPMIEVTKRLTVMQCSVVR